MSNKYEKLDKPICDCCAFGVDDLMACLMAWEKEMMKKHGWYIHFVFDDDTPFNTNIHTHGLVETYKHRDVQICAPLSQETAQAILAGLVQRIKAGDKFAAGEKVFELIQNYPVTFIKATENDREVLRIIFPDETGNLDPNEMNEVWARQYDVLGGQ